MQQDGAMEKIDLLIWVDSVDVWRLAPGAWRLA
jgi:hypothetical protein